MSIDQLWSLRELIVSDLARKLMEEKAKVDQRLKRIDVEVVSRERRPYPRVVPKFRNPARPSETWAGRGKQPRWLTAALRSGKRLDDFRIQARSLRTGSVR
jgi:DNA-binding protein H-NS